MTTLVTERLKLRPLVPGDVEALHHFHNDPEVRRYLWDNQQVSTETVAEIVHASEACFDELGIGFFAIEIQETPDELVGFCGVRRFEGGEQPELLYGLLPDYWGEGFVTEAAHAVLRHSFEVCGLNSIVGATDTPNQRSVRTMQRLGMVFQERREYRGLDMVFYGLNREEFIA